jgi:hypothetical protein
MPQFSDDLFLGTAQSFVGVNTNSNLGNPAPMDLGFGPMGRVYLLDETPAAVTTAAILAASSPASATSATTYSGTSLAAASTTAGVTRVTRTDGTLVDQMDYPRAVSVSTGAFTAATFVTANITASNTTGSFAVATTPLVGLAVGQTMTVTGTNSGTNTGFAAGTYLISATNGTTTFTLVTTAGAAITTVTSGTNTGLTFANTLTAVPVLVSGYDYYGQFMSEYIITSTSASTAVNGRKAFFQVSSVSMVASGGAISVDNTKVMGLPAKITDTSYIITAKVTGSNSFDNTSGVVVGLGGGTTNYATQAITNFTAASPGVVTVAYSPPSGTLVTLTGALGTLTGVSLNTTYWWTNINATTGKLSTTQANYLSGTFVNTSGTTITSGMNLVPSSVSTPTTPDVRGTYAISATPDGLKRLLISMGLTAIQVGPNSTRAGLLGSDQA